MKWLCASSLWSFYANVICQLWRCWFLVLFFGISFDFKAKHRWLVSKIQISSSSRLLFLSILFPFYSTPLRSVPHTPIIWSRYSEIIRRFLNYIRWFFISLWLFLLLIFVVSFSLIGLNCEKKAGGHNRWTSFLKTINQLPTIYLFVSMKKN